MKKLADILKEYKPGKNISDGGLIYIKKQGKDGNPLNFELDAKKNIAKSGNWIPGLTKKKITWILVFHKSDKEKNQIWIGDYKKTEEIPGKKTKKNKIFHLSNVVGPLDVECSFEEFTGHKASEGPIYSSNKPRNKYFDDNAIAKDIQDIIENIQDATTRQQLIDARIGQGKFRADVLKLWEYSCAVTGSKTKEALRASHMRPWCKCENDRLNPKNGLPLIATLDALFDRGLITFKADGAMQISKSLSDEEKSLLGLTEGSPNRNSLRKGLDEEQKKFLKYHRESVFKKS